MKIKKVTYGIGGHDETKPNNNIVDVEYYTDEELAALEIELMGGYEDSSLYNSTE